MSNNSLQQLTLMLSEITDSEYRLGLRTNSPLPSNAELHELMQLLKGVLFPGFFDKKAISPNARQYQLGVDIDRIHSLLHNQIARGFLFCSRLEEQQVCTQTEHIAEQFMAQLPEIKRVLLTDVEAVAMRDPAVNNYGEVVFSYPAITVMLYYRVAHALYKLGVPIIPRIIAEQAHSLTGIDIHPAATIGEYFAIDHGTGVVIGATTIIGNHVMIYQGVTLGAKSFEYDSNGHPLDLPRHPIIEDYVTIYSNASILGRITIGHHTTIGGNVWITNDVPPRSRILQGKPIEQRGFSDGEGI